MSDPRFDYEYNREHSHERFRPEADGMGMAGGLMVVAAIMLLLGSAIYFTGDRRDTAGNSPTQMVERSTQAPAPPPSRPAQ